MGGTLVLLFNVLGGGQSETITGVILSQARSDTLTDGRNTGTTANTGRNTSTTEDG